MSFTAYLDELTSDERRALERLINIIQKQVPEATEGLSYGLPAFKYHNRPLLGFSANKYGLNVYPFDPKIVSAVKPQLTDFEVSKGVIRFTPERPIPREVILLMIDLRLETLNK